MSFCLRLFNNCLQISVAEEDLFHVFRLGRRGESEDAQDPCCLKCLDDAGIESLVCGHKLGLRLVKMSVGVLAVDFMVCNYSTTLAG